MVGFTPAMQATVFMAFAAAGDMYHAVELLPHCIAKVRDWSAALVLAAAAVLPVRVQLDG